MYLSHNYLSRLWKKGFRNGNLRKLSRIERALYLASLSLARKRGRIVNPKLILELKNIIGRIKETDGDRFTRDAYERAMKLYERYKTTNLFLWAPQVKSWFNDPHYIIWIGFFT